MMTMPLDPENFHAILKLARHISSSPMSNSFRPPTTLSIDVRRLASTSHGEAAMILLFILFRHLCILNICIIFILQALVPRGMSASAPSARPMPRIHESHGLIFLLLPDGGLADLDLDPLLSTDGVDVFKHQDERFFKNSEGEWQYYER